MFVHTIDPTLISIGPLSIQYYGLFYALGFVLAFFILHHFSKKKKLDLTEDEISDYLLYIIIGTIVGARLVYVFIYNAGYYFSNPSDIIAVWKGGLSFHGGFVGAIVAGYVFCKKHRKSFLQLADYSVIPLALGLVFGRIANFINAELYGRETSVSWCVVFPQGGDACRHPSQLYESFKNLIIFLVLWFVSGKKVKQGTLFGLFIVLYGILRFSVEFFREADIQLGYFLGLTMGQILSLLMVILGSSFLYYINKK